MPFLTCSDCGFEYDESFFKLKGYILRCITCQKLKRNNGVNKRTNELRRRVLGYLMSHPCVDCGLNDPVCLSFDHVRGIKSMNVSRMIQNTYSWKCIQAEIRKCEVRCHNCHAKKTANTFGWYKDIDFTDLIVEPEEPES